jgi:hypothetical protein
MRCVCCHQSMRKWTDIVYAPHASAGSSVPVAGWRYDGDGQIVARRYVTVDPVLNCFVLDDEGAPPGAERRLYSVSIWDGKTYHANRERFCTDRCAGRFAIMAYDAGFRTVVTSRNALRKAR